MGWMGINRVSAIDKMLRAEWAEVGLKWCPKSKHISSIEDFGSNTTRPDGAACWCRVCLNKNQSISQKNNPKRTNSQNRVMQLRKLKRVPIWSETEQIKQYYIGCPKGYQVDHLIPLQGKNVSGLHVIGNLQYLTKSENCSKGNKWIP